MDLNGLNVIEFSGESCANCISLMPLLHSLLKKYDDVKLHHVEVSHDTMDIVKKYNVDRVPTILIVKDGVEVDRCRGFQPEEILEIWLDAKFSQARN